MLAIVCAQKQGLFEEWFGHNFEDVAPDVADWSERHRYAACVKPLRVRATAPLVVALANSGEYAELPSTGPQARKGGNGSEEAT